MTPARPSSASAVPDSSATVRASSGSWASTRAPSPDHTSRLAAPSARVAPPASDLARSSDRSQEVASRR